MTAEELFRWLFHERTCHDLSQVKVRIEVSDSYYDKDLESVQQLKFRCDDESGSMTLFFHGG